MCIKSINAERQSRIILWPTYLKSCVCISESVCVCVCVCVCVRYLYMGGMCVVGMYMSLGGYVGEVELWGGG